MQKVTGREVSDLTAGIQYKKDRCSRRRLSSYSNFKKQRSRGGLARCQVHVYMVNPKSLQ